jgi:hypothetical protein
VEQSQPRERRDAVILRERRDAVILRERRDRRIAVPGERSFASLRMTPASLRSR